MKDIAEVYMARISALREWLARRANKNQLKHSLIVSLPLAGLSTFTYIYFFPSTVSFTIQLNDPLISSSSNAPKLNALLGNTRSDPTLMKYLSSQGYLCRNLPTISGFSEVHTRLTKDIQKRCAANRPLPPYIKSSFAKGERYEDLQAIRFTLESYNPRIDLVWIKNLAIFYSSQSKSFAKIRIDSVNQAIRKSEVQSSIDSDELRKTLFDLIAKHRGPLDEKYKAYTQQLVEVEKLSAGYEPRKVQLISSLAAQMNITPERVLPIVQTLNGLNRDDSEQLLKSLQDINVRLIRLRAGSSEKNPEYQNTLKLRSSLIAEINSKVPGFNKVASLQPNPETLSKTIETVIELQTLEYQIAENRRLTSTLLSSLKEISRELPQYVLLQSKISAQDDAIVNAAKDNETLKIELNKLVGTWDILEGPYVRRTSPAVIFVIFYLCAFLLMYLILLNDISRLVYRQVIASVQTSQGDKE